MSFVHRLMHPSDTERVPLARPLIGSEEEQAVCCVLKSGWISQGPRVVELEESLAKLLGCRYVRMVNSGTSALLLALKALGIGPGTSVVLPSFTCAASALPVLALGAEPLFADIDLATFNITWHQVRRVIRTDTKAVVLVHMFGRTADAHEFEKQCVERGISLIEDAALAFGARKAGRAAGTFGRAGCFSFHPRKIITTGEGGAVCTNDAELAANVETDRNYGAATTAWTRFQTNQGSVAGFNRLAFNFKMTDIQAAIGICQVSRLPHFLQERRRIASAYREALSGIPKIRILGPAPETGEDVAQAFVCLWAPESLDTLLRDEAALRRATDSASRFKAAVIQRGVAISEAAQLLPELPVFRGKTLAAGAPRESWPAALVAARLSFALPIFPGLENQQLMRVIEAVRDAAATAA